MRLTLDIPDEAHRRIKTLAAFHGMSMKDFILKRTLEELAEEKENAADAVPLPGSPWRVKPDDMDETEWIMGSPWLVDRLDKSLKQIEEGKVVSFDSVEDLRRAIGLE